MVSYISHRTIYDIYKDICFSYIYYIGFNELNCDCGRSIYVQCTIHIDP
jgi:hypothetical protein